MDKGVKLKMKFGQELAQVMDEHGENQTDIAQIACVSNSSISKYTLGTRRIPKDVIRVTASHYDDPRLFVAAQEEVTGGACTPWLNGADLHKSTVQIKTQEELSEAQVAICTVSITKRKDQLAEKDIENIKIAITESIEAITALTHYVAVLCKEYSFSWLTMWNEHRKQLKMQKYVK
jgi:transcriptional regulator with XRE-family HTH domain